MFVFAFRSSGPSAHILLGAPPSGMEKSANYVRKMPIQAPAKREERICAIGDFYKSFGCFSMLMEDGRRYTSTPY